MSVAATELTPNGWLTSDPATRQEPASSPPTPHTHVGSPGPAVGSNVGSHVSAGRGVFLLIRLSALIRGWCPRVDHQPAASRQHCIEPGCLTLPPTPAELRRPAPPGGVDDGVVPHRGAFGGDCVGLVR